MFISVYTCLLTFVNIFGRSTQQIQTDHAKRDSRISLGSAKLQVVTIDKVLFTARLVEAATYMAIGAISQYCCFCFFGLLLGGSSHES